MQITDIQVFTPPQNTLSKGNLNQRRDGSIDALKFLLICTVVLGHVIMALDYGKLERAIFYWIYSFHMPLFIFISGYFTKVGQRTNKSFTAATHFLSLFVLFNLFMWLIVPRGINIRSVLTPQYAMWYLLSMFYWKLGAMLVSDSVLTKRNFIYITILSCVVGFIPYINEILSFNRTFCFLCFFMAGIMARKWNVIHKIKKFPVWTALMGIFGSLLFIICFYHYGLRYVYSNSYGFHIIGFVERCANMVLAVLISLGFIRISQIRFPKWVSWAGTKTLFIYLYHTFFIAALPWVSKFLGLPNNIIISIIISAIIIAILLLLTHISFLETFLKWNMFKKSLEKIYTKYHIQ